MVAKSKNFLEFDFHRAKIILTSSLLHAPSELEVFLAVDKWVGYSAGQRRRKALDLLKSVRLGLLSENVLSGVLSGEYTLSNIPDCKKHIQMALKGKSQTPSQPCDKGHQSRHCGSKEFDVLVFEVQKDGKSRVIQLERGDLSKPTEVATSPLNPRAQPFSAVIDEKLYVFGGYADNQYLPMMEVYCPASKKWENFALMPSYQEIYHSCTLMGKIYIFGAKLDDSHLFSVFDPDTRVWSEKTAASKFSHWSACEAYRGNVMVSGGRGHPHNVEAYDHFNDVWFYLPRTLEERQGHAMVAVKNKLHVIGGCHNEPRPCEVYDGVNDRFTLTKTFPAMDNTNTALNFRTVAVGSKILVVSFWSERHACYDVDKDEWSYVESSEFHYTISCVKYKL